MNGNSDIATPNRPFIQARFDQRPQGRSRGDDDLNPGMNPVRKQLIPAAVLVPIVEREDGLTVLLTRRTDHLHDHAGQVSFPGGRVEETDRNLIETALRETEEEIGLHRRHIHTIGHLDRYITRTGFDVTPVVAMIEPPFTLRPDSFEVAEVFEVPLSFFMERENHQKQSREWQGKTRHFYVMPYLEYYIWGATAGMLVNLVDILSER